MPDITLYFAYPGDLDTPSGGYHYDRRLIAALERRGTRVRQISLPHCSLGMPAELLAAVHSRFCELPDGAVAIIDGLAFGLLGSVAEIHAKRLRLIALCHHPLALETGLSGEQQRALRQAEQHALQCASATIVTSQHTRQILVEQYGVPSASITVALPGTDKARIASCEGEPPRLLTVASLTRRKAHDVLIAALGQLRQLPWQARFVGSNEFDPVWVTRLRDQVLAQKLGDRIDFAGEVCDVSLEYQAADLFVLPSRFEGYGMAFAEALASGLPVIAARAGAVPEVVPESAGMLVPPDDVGALAAALRHVLTDKNRYAQLRAGARDLAAGLPGWDDCAYRVEHAVSQLVNSRKEGGRL